MIIMPKVKKETLIRTLVTAVTMINMLLTMTGKNPLPFSEDEVYIGISAAVLEIIKGSKNTIIANKPRLIVNLGTMKEELFLIPLYIKEIEPSYKLYFRFQSSMPSRLFLYAVP